MKKKNLINKKQHQIFVEKLRNIKLNSTKAKQCKRSNSISKICNPVSGQLVSKVGDQGILIKQILHNGKSPNITYKPLSVQKHVKLMSKKQHQPLIKKLNEMNVKKECKQPTSNSKICNPLTGRLVDKNTEQGQIIMYYLTVFKQKNIKTVQPKTVKANKISSINKLSKLKQHSKLTEKLKLIQNGKLNVKECSKPPPIDKICNPVTGQLIQKNTAQAKLVNHFMKSVKVVKSEPILTKKVDKKKAKELLKKFFKKRKMLKKSGKCIKQFKITREELFKHRCCAMVNGLKKRERTKIMYYSWTRDLTKENLRGVNEVNQYLDKFDNIENIKKRSADYVSSLLPDLQTILKHYTLYGDGIINHYIREKNLSEQTFKRVFEKHNKHINNDFCTPSSDSPGSVGTYLTRLAIYNARRDLYVEDETDFELNIEYISDQKRYRFTDKNGDKITYQNKDAVKFVTKLLNNTLISFQTILNNAPKIEKDIYVFRGIRTRRNTEDVMQRFNGFNSFSLDPQVGHNFSMMKGTTNGTVYRLLVQKGTPLLYLSNSMIESEEEVLLPTGGIFYKPKLNCDGSIYIENVELLVNRANIKVTKESTKIKKSILPMIYIWSKDALFKKFKFLNK